MARPSLAEVRRPELLDAYARSLLKHGSEGATLDRIAEEAGVTRGLVRHYLGNRKDVDRALLDHIRERYVHGLQALGVGRSRAERLPAILAGIFPGLSGDPTARLVDTLLGASADDAVLRERLREIYVELERLLESELSAAYPTSRRAARRQVAYGIVCLAGMNESLIELGMPADRSRAARACAEHLVASLSMEGMAPAQGPGSFGRYPKDHRTKG
jgi:AcrR family transcriptional regulator